MPLLSRSGRSPRPPTRSIRTTGAPRSGQSPSNGYSVHEPQSHGRPNFPLDGLGRAKWAKVILLLLPSSSAQDHGAARGSRFSAVAHTLPPLRRFRGSLESRTRGARRSTRIRSSYRYYRYTRRNNLCFCRRMQSMMRARVCRMQVYSSRPASDLGQSEKFRNVCFRVRLLVSAVHARTTDP